MIRLDEVLSPSSVAAARELFTEYMAWTLTLGVDPAEAPTFDGFDQEVRDLPGDYAPLLLATLDGAPAGCIALKRVDHETAELKRLWVRPHARGNGIGGRLVAALLAAARTAGYRRVILDSHISMRDAHEIYRRAGFREVGSPPSFPSKLRPVVVFMEHDLGSHS